MVHVPRAFYRAAGRSCVNRGRNISFSRASFPGLAAVASELAIALFASTMVLLFLPKLLQYYADRV